jgi:hypothetical protein
MMTWKTRLSKCLAVGALVALPQAGFANKVKESIKVQAQTEKAAETSQKKVEKLADQTSTMLDEYRMILRQTDSLTAYNDQMARLVLSQNEEKLSIHEQIGEIELTSREVVPLMIDMLDTLEKFVALDVPFLPEERENRVASLKKDMNRADVTTSEKFRRILEAYQVENEYGRTIEAYRGEIKDGEKVRTVDFLKIGRVALIYRTLDGDDAKAWSQKTRSWIALDDSYRKSILHGLKIARKQSAPDLLTLPIPTVEVSK